MIELKVYNNGVSTESYNIWINQVSKAIKIIKTLTANSFTKANILPVFQQQTNKNPSFMYLIHPNLNQFAS